MRSDPFLHGGVESAEEVRAFSDMIADKNVCGSFYASERTSAPAVEAVVDDDEMFFEGVDIEGGLNDVPGKNMGTMEEERSDMVVVRFDEEITHK